MDNHDSVHLVTFFPLLGVAAAAACPERTGTTRSRVSALIIAFITMLLSFCHATSSSIPMAQRDAV